jgi:predicted nucleotidyltransferase
MDIIYIIVSVVITPLAFLLKAISCGLIDMTNVEEKLDVLYEILFGMSDMDIKGFRRLRTISQLSFESLPQIILQCRILLYGFMHDG